MAHSEHKSLRRLFEVVYEAPAAERDAILDRECGSDTQLKQRLRTMVRAAEEDSFLDEPTPDAPPVPRLEDVVTVDPERPEPPSQIIDRYKILQQIGEGGFGVVYMAEQQEPVRRRVALKIIKLGMDTKQVIARFEAERQALALMDHPNIAKVLDAGATDSGRPYFVMELVRGTSITEYCDSQNVPFAERLQLFTQVCSAVQHAHQKGIIHRDIKPTNILITHVDGKPVPKVIDFGIAKATQQRLTEMTMFTGFGQFLGTPTYMAPEQTDPNALDIDTRSDIYSLGVVLYELLTGTTPFDIRTLRNAAWDEIKRIIREVEPGKPSTRLSTLGEELTTVAKHRGLEPKRLCTCLRGDLDWIILKALEKDRSRRYESASGFAADIERYINDQPVSAGPPGAAYRLRKFVKRNRTAVTAASLIAIVLTLGVLGTTWGMLWALDEKHRADLEATNALASADAEMRARQDAQHAARLAMDAEARAAAARDEAERRAGELEIVTEFQQSMLSDIDAEGMGRALYADLQARVRRALDAEDLTDDERREIEAAFERTLERANATDVALTLVDEQVLSRAANTIESDFADQPIVRAALRQTVADTYVEIGRYPPAMPLQQAALQTREQLLGSDHPDTLHSMDSMGRVLEAMGRYEEAESYYLAELDGCRRVFGDDDPSTFIALNNLAILVAKRDRHEESYALHKAALEGRRRVLGDDHPETLSSLDSLASELWSLGRNDEALVCYREALEGSRRVLGDDHTRTLSVLNNLATLLQSMGDLEGARECLEEALAGRRRLHGADHPETLVTTINLGSLYLRLGELETALPYYREALDGWRKTLGDDHPDTLIAVAYVGVVLRALDRLEEAEPYFRESLAGNRRALGDDHERTIIAVHNMGRLLRDLGQLDEAERLGAEAVAWARRSRPEGHPDIAAYELSYGQTLTRLGRYVEAEAALLESYEVIAATFGAEHRRARGAAAAVVDLYDTWHAADPTAGHDAQANVYRARVEEPTPPAASSDAD